MKTKLLKSVLLGATFLLYTGLAFSQNILPTDAYGFELTNVDWNNKNTGDQTGNIVEAWTQVAGFTQSLDQAQSGTYSMKCDLVATAGTVPKLQTWRSNTNSEHEFTTELATYKVKAWVRVTGDAASNIKITINSQPAKPNLTLNFPDTPTGDWEQIEATTTFDATEAETVGWISFSLVGIPATPTAGSVTYFDNITIEKDATASVNKINNELSGVSVFPNPATDKVNVTAPSGSEVSITNIAGVVVRQVQTSSDNTVISTENLPSGIYIVTVVSEGKTAVSKLIKN
ncbi:T9SS type A sorting domain-containing protein [Flavicella sediminum]|uniref:T9SS type A sorting domain-containing protein n=1 Tax=Flavicella sediminum TaxID=2585141 RepID=UPI00112175F2|nr:T9SS type A sorting domain-containing protein [Flavicella sediminum]